VSHLRKMSKRSKTSHKVLFSDTLSQWRDQTERRRRIERANSSSIASKKKKQQALLTSQEASLRAARYSMVEVGYSEISFNAQFTPLFEDRYLLPDIRLTRQASLRDTIFAMIPLEIWNDLYIELCWNLEKLKEKEAEAPIHRVSASKRPKKRPRAMKSWGNYRTITQQEFWRFIATLVHCASSNDSSIDMMYSSSLHSRYLLAKLLPERLFMTLRASFRLFDIPKLCERLSQVWCSKMIASGVFAIDESLWKYVCKTKKTENYNVVRTIPRKPAGTGILSYELVGYSGRIKAPFTFGICPVTDTQKPSSTNAAFSLIDTWNAFKPDGSPEHPVAIMDAAFSSTPALDGYETRGWKYIASVNSQAHQQMSNALTSGLQPFEYRIFARDSDNRVYTAYSTRFSPTDKQKQRGTGNGSPLMILNVTNAYQVLHPRISSSNPSTSVENRQSPPSSLPTASSSNSQQPSAPAPQIPGNSGPVTLRISGPLISVVHQRLREEEAEQRRLQFIQQTPYDQIVLGGTSLSRQQVLQMTKEDALKFLVKLGFPSKRKWTKNQLLEFIWKIQNEENFDRVASSMEGKGKRTYSDELKDKLPMLHVYREQFASIDRLDIFLSNSDSEIRHQSWRTRLLERVLFVAFNNARVLLAERGMNSKGIPYERLTTAQYLQLLFDFFLSLADAREPLLRGFNDAWNAPASTNSRP